MVFFGNVLWVGGSSGSGKSTVVRLLCRRHGLRCYSSDTRTWDHRDRAIAAGDPRAIEWEALTPAERSQLDPQAQSRLVFDRSVYVVDDVAALPARPAVIAEGTTLTPGTVPAGSRAVWLEADPQTRTERARGRGWGAAGGPVDMLHTAALTAALDGQSIARINTSTHTGPQETIAEIERLLQSWLDQQPIAESAEEQRQLRRELNITIAEQYRASLTRSGAIAHQIVRPYECECSDRSCARFIDIALDQIPDPFTTESPPLISPQHT